MSDRYEIRGKLGRGGMSAIYRAYDTVMGREVALKRLLPLEATNLNEDSGEVLSKEAAALARFQHPNIVTVFAFEEDKDGPYVAMELIEGEDLHAVLVGGALSYDDFKDVARQCLEPLVEAGEQNLLHRDIKPGNIMLTLTHSGRFLVKILDFGLAKFSQQPSLQTLDQSGSFLGSIDYIAPEQLELKPLDQRTDLYSLGCVLYYALAQEPPFTGDNPAQTTMNHLKHRCRPIHEFRKDVPELVLDWVMRMISRKRADRPMDAVEALGQFEDAVRGVPFTGEPATMPMKGGPREKPTQSPPPVSGRIQILTGPVSGPQSPASRAPSPTPTTGPSPSQATGSVSRARASGQKFQRRGRIRYRSAEESQEARPARSAAPVSGNGLAPKISPQSLWIAGAAGGLIAIIGLIVAFSGRERSPIPPTAEERDGNRGDEGGKADSLPELAYPSQLLRSDGQPEPVPVPIVNGLVGRWVSGKGLYGRDYRSRANAGDQVAAWYNLAGEGRSDSLLRDGSDKTGEFLPRVLLLTPGEVTNLAGTYRGVGLSNTTALSTPADSFDFHRGFTVVVVGKLYAGTDKILRILPKAWDGSYMNLMMDYAGNVVGAAKPDPEVGEARVSVSWAHRNAGVVAYAVDFENGTQRISAKDQAAGAVSLDEDEIQKLPEVKFSKISIGKRGFTDGYEEPFHNALLEILLYDRSLSAVEVERSVGFLWERYFTEE